MPSSALETSLTYPFSYYRNFLCYLFNGNNSPKPTAALEAHDHTQHCHKFLKKRNATQRLKPCFSCANCYIPVCFKDLKSQAKSCVLYVFLKSLKYM